MINGTTLAWGRSSAFGWMVNEDFTKMAAFELTAE